MQHTDGFMETAGFMAESVEKIFHLSEQVSFFLTTAACISTLPIPIKLYLICLGNFHKYTCTCTSVLLEDIISH